MARKMNRKTRNVISGILVSVASIFAVINFADVPAEEIRSFLLSTALLFLLIILLALLAVSVFKIIGWLKNRLLDSSEQSASAQSAPESGDKEDKA